MLLLGAVVDSLAGLVPGQSSTALGLELLLLSATFAVIVVQLLLVIIPALPDHVRREFVCVLALPGTLPSCSGRSACSRSRAAACTGWPAASRARSSELSPNAWVLLVEIVR
jgi:hypothetical protein